MIDDLGAIPSPSYVLDMEVFEGNIEKIYRFQKAADVHLIPALKGFALWKLFAKLTPYVSGAAASGLYESRLIYEELGVYAHTYSPAFREDEFPSILDFSSHITFNSVAQCTSFIPLVKEYNAAGGRHVSWGMRVNPGYSPVKTALYNPASEESRLGVDYRDAAALDPGLLEGLHFHVLCESSAEESKTAVDVFEQRCGDLLKSGHIRWVNFGGGHLITREGYDIETLIACLSSFRKRYPGIAVYLEPSSAWAWNAGVLRSKVLDVVVSGGKRTAILDVSFTAHMPDCLEMPYQPRVKGAEIADETAGTDGLCYRLGGCSCLAGDFMGDWVFPRELKTGDDVVFLDMLHYTTVKTTMFNGVRHPSIGIVENGAFRELRRFDYHDYKQRMS